MTSASFPLRGWATPLTISAFALMSATGVLMFFHWDRGLTNDLHEWFSWLFLAAVATHVVVNWRPLLNYLRRNLGRGALMACALLFLAAQFQWGVLTAPQIRRSIETALIEAPLAALAGVTRTEPDALLRRLKSHGIDAGGQQSIQNLAKLNNVDEHRLLAIVFSPEP